MFSVITNKPVAYDSPDHIYPHGTKNDSSRNLNFNKIIEGLFNNPIKIIDIGCSGGNMIEDFVNNNHLAIGIEGSDYSQKIKRESWKRIPDNLFTADVTEDFQILYNNQPFKANVITAWEVMEHFKEEKIDNVIENINKHLDNNGLFIASISLRREGNEKWHQCVKDKEWWIEKFKDFTLRKDIINLICENRAWVREPELGIVLEKK